MNRSRPLPSLQPDIRLFGSIGDAMLSEFFRQQAEAASDKPVVFEISTSGGDADIARRIAQELRLWQRRQAREVFFLGKTFVFSGGITIMAAVPPTHRFLTADCELLIHERKLTMDIHLDGALRGCRTALNDVLASIESGQRLEREGFEQLVAGTPLSVDDIERRVLEKDWYLGAAEAKAIGLVADVI